MFCTDYFSATRRERYCRCFKADVKVVGRPGEGCLCNTAVRQLPATLAQGSVTVFVSFEMLFLSLQKDGCVQMCSAVPGSSGLKLSLCRRKSLGLCSQLFLVLIPRRLWVVKYAANGRGNNPTAICTPSHHSRSGAALPRAVLKMTASPGQPGLGARMETLFCVGPRSLHVPKQ